MIGFFLRKETDGFDCICAVYCSPTERLKGPQGQGKAEFYHFSLTNKTEEFITFPGRKSYSWSHVRPRGEVPNVDTLQEHLYQYQDNSKLMSGDL